MVDRRQNSLFVTQLLNRLFAIISFVALFGEKAQAHTDTELPLLFWENADITNIFGKLTFGAEILQPGKSSFPNMQFGCEVRRSDHNSAVYGWRMLNWQKKPQRAIEILRCATTDGTNFSSTETLFAITNKDWQGFANIVHRPTDNSLFFFAWSAGALEVFRSSDGSHWEELTRKAYQGHDAMCIIWYPPFDKFLNYQNAIQPFPKRYPDNIGRNRRVMSFRRSADGITWESFS